MGKSRHSRGPVTRERLIEAAGEVFAEKGLHGALIRDITRRAGANIAAVNYHFHDKFELYTLVLRRAHESRIAGMSQPLTADTPEGRVRQMLSAMLAAALDPTRPKWQMRLLGRELVQPTPALDLMHDIMRPTAQRLCAAIRQIRPDLSDQDLMLAVAGVVAQPIFHAHHAHMVRRVFPTVPEPDVATLIERVVDFSLAALRGLRPRPTPPPGKARGAVGSTHTEARHTEAARVKPRAPPPRAPSPAAQHRPPPNATPPRARRQATQARAPQAAPQADLPAAPGRGVAGWRGRGVAGHCPTPTLTREACPSIMVVARRPCRLRA